MFCTSSYFGGIICTYIKAFEGANYEEGNTGTLHSKLPFLENNKSRFEDMKYL